MDVFFSTGEKSGDRIAAAVAVALRREFPDLDLAGLTGPDAMRAGIRGAFDGTDFAMTGVDWRNVRAWSRLLPAVLEMIRRRPPKLFVAVAHPTFNLPLAGLLPAGVRKIIIGPPEIWGWETTRLAGAIASAIGWVPRLLGRTFSTLHAPYIAARRGPLALRNFDDLLCLTPMNLAAYTALRERLGAAARIAQVVHPAAALRRTEELDRRAADLRANLRLADGEHLLGIFPGSREGELRVVLPRMLQAAREILRRRDDVRAAVSVSDRRFEPLVATLLERHGGGLCQAGRLQTTSAPANELLAASCHAMLCSGTLTLEAACLGAAGTVCYRLTPTGAVLLRTFCHHRYIAGRPAPLGLPNALAAFAGVGPRELPYAECVKSRCRANLITRCVQDALPAGPHTKDCRPRLDERMESLIRQSIQPAGACPPAEHVLRIYRDLSA
ncbi:MAG TPA: hypothetical protein PK082_09690 [Phycisphaerae bacterium]|nr:hypothetical protein [Phycisphaerae bacterium]